MAENSITSYIDTLGQSLLARKEWLEHSELVRLKENLRTFQSSFASLFNIYLKKKLIDEDPYKHEAKISELEVPDSTPFQDAKRVEQLSIRLSNYDNQLDFLVNFYQLGIDFLNLERIKRILGLIRYIDWGSFSADSQDLMTAAVADMNTHAKQGVDSLTVSIIGGGLSRLSKSTSEIVSILKNLNLYYRESYKLTVRKNITKDFSESEATLENIKKKMPHVMPGSPFYRELIEEIIKEDYSPRGIDIKDNVLNSLKVTIEKPKAAKPTVDYKKILLDGIQVIGGASNSLVEIAAKLDENQAVMESGKKGFLHALKELIRQITHAEPEEVIYDVEYLDSTSGVKVKEKISFHQFKEDMNKKTRILSNFVRGPAYQKIAVMTEDQIIGYLERYIREVQTLHRTLNALDDYFKTTVPAEDREKIKGIKPELSALKNTIVKSNQMRYEYSAQKEEEDQMKRLGLTPGVLGAAPIPASDSPVEPVRKP